MANISLEGQGLSNRISEKGRCESDPMVDKKKRERSHYSIRAPSSGNVSLSFFSEYAELYHAPSPKRSCLRSTYLHLSEKNMRAPSFLPCPSLPFLCHFPTISVARDGAFPSPPWPTSFPSSVPRARALCQPLINVLDSYHPFKNPPLPILQRLSRGLFHFTPQICSRYRRRRERASHRPCQRPHRHSRWTSSEMVGRSRR